MHDVRSTSGSGAPEREHAYEMSVLCAEIAHELSGPLLFLRDVTLNGNLLPDDRESGQEQIGRLETLVAQLRRASMRLSHSSVLELMPVLERFRERVQLEEGLGVQWDLAIPARAMLQATPWMLELMLLSLIRAARSADGVTLEARAAPDGAGVVLRILQKGLSVSLKAATHGLHALGTGGRGIELVVAQHVARSHGWRLHVTDGARDTSADPRRLNRTIEIHLPCQWTASA